MGHVLKVHRGTPKGDSSTHLCRSCTFGVVMESARGEQRTTCRASDFEEKRVPFLVTSCTYYEDKTLPKLWDLEKIAWLLHTDLKGRKVGFLSPHEAKMRKDKLRELEPLDG